MSRASQRQETFSTVFEATLASLAVKVWHEWPEPIMRRMGAGCWFAALLFGSGVLVVSLPSIAIASWFTWLTRRHKPHEHRQRANCTDLAVPPAAEYLLYLFLAKSDRACVPGDLAE